MLGGEKLRFEGRKNRRLAAEASGSIFYWPKVVQNNGH